MPKGKEAGSGKGVGSKRVPTSDGGPADRGKETLECGMKILTPVPLAATVIGKGGASISEMRTKCQARLSLSEHGEFFANTDCRVMTCQTNDEEHMNEVITEFVAKLVECATEKKFDEAVGTEEELKAKVLLPRAAVGGVIGKGGAKIRELREENSAKISIFDPTGSGPSADQLVAVAGSAEAIEAVLTEINAQVQALNGEDWFASWVMTNSTHHSGLGAYSAPGPSASYASYGGPSRGHGVDTLIRVAHSLPNYVMEDTRGFALSCVVPQRLVGGLIGRSGNGIKEVQSMTGTRIGIRDIADDPDSCSLNIAGNLANACAAYMLMMRRYLDAEHVAAEGR